MDNLSVFQVKSLVFIKSGWTFHLAYWILTESDNDNGNRSELLFVQAPRNSSNVEIILNEKKKFFLIYLFRHKIKFGRGEIYERNRIFIAQPRLKPRKL